MSQYTFKFIVTGSSVAEDELTLLSFTGQENISVLFDFELSLRCDDLGLDEDDILNQDCRLEIYYQEGTLPATEPMRVIHGMVNEFEDVDYYPDHTLYRARMVPRVWQLGLFETNEVYLGESIDETLTVILEEAGFINNQDFRFNLNRTYRKWPFRLQYKETHLSYLQRIIEREGIYYYFESGETGEVMVFCDHNQALPEIAARGDINGAVNYQTGGALNVISKANTLTSIICKRQSLPKKVTLRDFNDETPSLDIRGEFLIDNRGMGEINLYGLNIMSPEEGEELAEIHANAYTCRHKIYSGEGDVATLSAGHTFTIENHPRPAFNQTPFLVESVYHEGINLVEGNSQANIDSNGQANYVNSFSSLLGDLEFAPQRQTSVPEIKGTLNAIVDTEAESDYAELDDSGRYKIKLPFDRKDKDGGKASHWVRMMQPYGGKSEGMHFPLRKGTRVLLGFIGGDPDRPFISGTIGDSSEQSSLVTAENQTNNVIQTASGNRIEFEDKEGKQRLKLESPTNNTYMHLGAPNHDGSGLVMVTAGIERREVEGGQRVNIKTKPVNESLIPTPYSDCSTYDIGDLVVHGGKTYECRTTIINGESFNSLKWDVLVDNKTPEYDESADYTKGATVLHNGDTYKSKMAIDNNSLFDSSKWEECEQINSYSTSAKYDKGDIAVESGKTYLCVKKVNKDDFDQDRWEEIEDFEHHESYSKDDHIKHSGKVYKCSGSVSASKFEQSQWENLNEEFRFYQKLADGSGSTLLDYADELGGAYITRRTEGNFYVAHKGAEFTFHPNLDFEYDDKTNKSPNNVIYSYGPKFMVNHIDATSDFAEGYDLLLRSSKKRAVNVDADGSDVHKDSKAQLDDDSLYEIDQELVSTMRTKIDQFDRANVHVGRAIKIRKSSEENDVVYEYDSDGMLLYANTGDYEAQWEVNDGEHQIVFESANGETRNWNSDGKLTFLEKDDGDYSETWEYDDSGKETSHLLAEGDRVQEWVTSIAGSPASYSDTVESGNNTNLFEANYESSSTQTSSFSFAASHEASFSMSAGVESSESIAISASASNSMSSEISIGLSNEMSFVISGSASMTLGMEISGGPSVSISNSVGLGGPSAEIEIEDGTVKKAEVSGFGVNCKLSAMATKLEAENAIQIRSESMKLLKETLELKATELQVGSSKANLSSSIITLIS